MNETESMKEVAHLKGLYPKTTQEQEDFWFMQFLKYPQGAVRSAVLSFAESHGDYADRPGLLTAIQDQVGRPTAAQRASAVQQEAQARRDAIEQGHSRVRATWKQIDTTIEALTDDELADWKRFAIDHNRATGVLHDLGAEFIGKLDSRKSRTLKAMIFDAMSSAPAEARVS